jgi:WD40 repeat protein
MGCVNTVLFSEDGSYAITGSDDTSVKLYDINDGRLIFNIHTPHTGNIFSAQDRPGSSCNEIITCAGHRTEVIISNNSLL